MNNIIENKVLDLIIRLKQCDRFDTDIPLIDSGILDSFDLMNLIAKIDNNFNVQIDGENLTPENFSTVKSIANLITFLQKQET